VSTAKLRPSTWKAQVPVNSSADCAAARPPAVTINAHKRTMLRVMWQALPTLEADYMTALTRAAAKLAAHNGAKEHRPARHTAATFETMNWHKARVIHKCRYSFM
jgi:hypothetical protein